MLFLIKGSLVLVFLEKVVLLMHTTDRDCTLMLLVSEMNIPVPLSPWLLMNTLSSTRIVTKTSLFTELPKMRSLLSSKIYIPAPVAALLLTNLQPETLRISLGRVRAPEQTGWTEVSEAMVPYCK